MDSRFDACLCHQQRHDEGQAADEEAVGVADDVGRRHPAGEGDRGVARGKAAPQRRAAPGPRLRPDDQDHGDDERDHRDLGGGIAQLVEDARAPVGGLACEHEVADGDGVDRGDQDRAGRDVLRQHRHRVEGRRRRVDRPFDGGVDHLRDEHERDREQQRDQLDLRDADGGGDDENRDRDGEVEPHVALRAQHVDDALDREVEALDDRRPRSHACVRSRACISTPWW